MRPAERLLGEELNGGWKVIDRVTRLPNQTGGHFSHGYIVEKADGTRGYLKALDYTQALQSADPAAVLEGMTKAYNFERRLCERCNKRSFRRVVRALDAGTVNVEGSPYGTVQYIIFELADRDIRVHLDQLERLDIALILRATHHIAVGVQQLHSVGIGHEDLKPSNVLVFDEEGTKVADLGRASAKGIEAPHDGAVIKGDLNYAPPELLYQYQYGSWDDRAFSCDLYHVGSLLAFFLTRHDMTSLIVSHLDPMFHWNRIQEPYSNVLVYLHDAFALAIDDCLEQAPGRLNSPLRELLSMMCNPDPNRRGHPRTIDSVHVNSYSLERFVSSLDLLASKAEHGLLGNLDDAGIS